MKPCYWFIWWVTSVLTNRIALIFQSYHLWKEKGSLCIFPAVRHLHLITRFDWFISALVIKRLENLLKRPCRKCIIFCNNSKACNFVSIKLQEANIDHSKLHGNMNPQVKQQFSNFFGGGNMLNTLYFTLLVEKKTDCFCYF